MCRVCDWVGWPLLLVFVGHRALARSMTGLRADGFWHGTGRPRRAIWLYDWAGGR